jgi:hypothetical protein
MKKGCVCIYVYHDLSNSKIDLSNFSIDQHIEASAISLSNSFEKIYIILIYRAASGNFTIFLKKKLESILNLFFRNNIKIILCGDITNFEALVGEQTIPTERAPVVGEVSANFCG